MKNDHRVWVHRVQVEVGDQREVEACEVDARQAPWADGCAGGELEADEQDRPNGVLEDHINKIKLPRVPRLAVCLGHVMALMQPVCLAAP